MSSKSLVFLCLIVKIFCTEASIVPTQSSTNDGLTIRLVNGTLPNEGRVELFHGGNWGTVCDDDWDIKDANVVCKMLGYPSALRVSRLMEFGEGTGKIILDDVNCLGSEKNIAECPHEGFYSNNCFHREDAGVICNLDNTGDHLVILGGFIGNPLSDVEVLDMQTEYKGCGPTDLPSPLWGHASVYSSTLQSLITCGGVGKYEYLSSCSVQSKNGHLISIPSMNSRRSYFAMVTIQNQIFSFGGYKTENTMETIKLNETGTWNQQSMPFSVRDHCAVVLDNNIIVIGGYNRNDKVDTWIYNVVKKNWTEGPKLNEKRFFPACLVDEETNTIHVMGGEGDNSEILKSTEKWTFGTDSWVSGASLPEAVVSPAAVNSNSEEHIGYLVAGFTENGITSKVWSLRRNDMMWIEDDSKQLQTPRRSHTVVNIPGDQIPGC